MFIVKKNINGNEYFYAQKSDRIDGKVKTKSVAYLGKDRISAEEKFKKLDGNEESVMKRKRIEIDELASYCKRKGFIYPSGEIYGSLSGFWDYGHLGVELNKNLKDEWWKFHVRGRNDIVGVDGSIITNPKVWEASGHVEGFVDVAIIEKKSGRKFKVDKHELVNYENNSDYEVQGEFNPMFTTQVGPVSSDSLKAYLRPETAQLIFANFKLIQENSRKQLPFGIAQIGKAFRNEISPREFLFRCREFEQMEIEYFIEEGMKCEFMDEIKEVDILVYSEEMQKNEEEAKVMNLFNAWKEGVIKNDWHAYWMAKEFLWFIEMGADPSNFRVRQHSSEEKSHYAKDTWDLEYKFPMGWRELQGFANRGDYDLSQHQKVSGKNMEILNNDKKVLPHVVCEPSLGVGRALLVFLFDAYYYDEERDNIVLRLSNKLAPVKAAVFPVVKNNEEIVNQAKEVYDEIKKEWNVEFDLSGSIGRRYSRQDEIGTPYCITVDEKTLTEGVTIRERDSRKQVRVSVGKVREVIRKLLDGEIVFEKAGKIVN